MPVHAVTLVWHSNRQTPANDGFFSSLLERDDFSSNRHHALAYWWSIIFSENRYPLFKIMLARLKALGRDDNRKV